LFADEVADEAERRAFEENIRQIASDTPQAKVAGGRLKKLIDKVKGVAGDVLKRAAAEVAASPIKDML
jgi:hypothetical protein